MWFCMFLRRVFSRTGSSDGYGLPFCGSLCPEKAFGTGLIAGFPLFGVPRIDLGGKEVSCAIRRWSGTGVTSRR